MTRRRHLLVTLGLGLAASALALAAVRTGFVAPVEGVAVDLLMRLRGERPADPRIAVCLIDGESVDRYGRWPWRRTLMASLVDRLSGAGARVVAFDVAFSEPSLSGPGFDLRGDDADLARALGQARERGTATELAFFFRRRPEPEVVLGAEAGGAGGPAGTAAPLRGDPANLLPATFDLVKGDPAAFAVAEYPSAEPNLDLFARAATSQGFVTGERETGVSRRQALAARFRGEIYPSLPLRAVALLTGAKLELAPDREGLPLLRVGDRAAEVDGRGRLWVAYPGGAESFRTYPVWRVIEGQVGRDELAGKLVFVGASEVGIGDFTATPFGAEVPGVLVQAAVADNLLGGRFLREAGAPRLLSFLALLAFGPGVALLVAAFERRRVVGSLVAVATVLLWPVVAYVAFARGGWHLEVVAPMAAAALALAAAFPYQVRTVDAQARQIRKTFEHYVSQAVVEEMLRHPERVKLGGERREMTVLFSDIRGFTSIAEGLDSEELVGLLNRFFTPMTRLVQAEGGTLDKYMGDALMAFYGAPVAQPDHALRACRAAIAMRSRLAELNAEWQAEGRLPAGVALGIGIGLNSGPMSVGNMGSEEVFDYTVIGDAVNLGSRIEGLNKLYKTEILASETTVRATSRISRGEIAFRELDRVRVKGKAEAVALFEVMGRRPLPAEAEALLAGFAEALALYRERRFEAAEEGFGALAAAGDSPSRVLADRCRHLGRHGAPADWEPVETLTTK